MVNKGNIKQKRNIDKMTSSNSIIQPLSAKRQGINALTISGGIQVKDMVRKFAEGKSYFIKTYGCQGNERDGETIAGILEKIGFTKANDYKTADLFLLNTCAVRENAEDKVYGKSGEVVNLKRKNPEMIFGICGCIPQESEITKDMLQRFPQIDLIFGTHNIQNIPLLLEELLIEQKTVVEVIADKAYVVENMPVSRMHNVKGFVNVMYGCDKFCTYCIVPYTRGKERSRTEEAILAEVKDMMNNGYKEVTLVGQSINNYGKDIGTNFASILTKVSDLGIDRIRFTTSNPWNFSDEVIDAIAKRQNIMPYVHLPAQSGNNDVLKRMGRLNTREEYLKVFKKLQVIKNLTVSTDIIVGFPGETRKQFEDTLSLYEECEFDNAYTFVYSPRVGTPAAKFEDFIDNQTKFEWLYELQEKVNHYAKISNEKMVGKIVKVLIDGTSKKDNNLFSGYTENWKLVNFSTNNSRDKIGDIVSVKITDASIHNLKGVRVDG